VHILLNVLAHSFKTMRHFCAPHLASVRNKPAGSPSGEPAHAADNSFTAKTLLNFRLVRWIIIFGIVLIGAIIAATGLVLLNLRNEDLVESEHELTGLTLVLAEQIDRSFQSMELLQNTTIGRMRDLSITSAEDYKRRMSGQDTYQHLKVQINGLPYVDALVLLDTEGKIINSSREWPAPFFEKSNQDFIEAFKSDPHLTAFVGKPFYNPIIKTWVLSIARRFSGPDGEYLGVVLGLMTVQSFELIFEAIAPTPNSSIALTRRDGMLLARWPRQDAVLGQSFPYREMLADLMSKSDHATTRRNGVFDGEDRLISARNLAHYPIVVVAATPVADAVAHWQSEFINLGILGVLLALVVGGVVFISACQIARTLRGQNLQFDAALSNMSQGLAMFDSSNRLVICNQRYLDMYGLPPEAVVPGCTLEEILDCRIAAGYFSPDDREQYLADILAARAQRTIFRKLTNLPDGRIIQILNHPVADGGWVATHEDVTKQKCAEDKLRHTNDELTMKNCQFDTALNNMVQGLLMFDRDAKLVVSNKRFAEMFEVSWGKWASSALGMTVPQAIQHCHELNKDVADTNASEILAAVKEMLDGQTPRNVVVKRTDGRVFDASMAPMANGGFVTTFEDITEKRRAEERFAYAAKHDALTGLPNRKLYHEHLEQALKRVQRGERLAVLYLDLDHLKRVNDTLGHSIGDKLLKGVADRLRGCTRDTNFVGHLSGDEFAIIQTMLDQPSDAAALAMRVREAIVKPFDLDGHQVKVDISIGISIAPSDANELSELLKTADIALYEAKNTGRGTYCFYQPAMSERMQTRALLERDLQSALGNGEFELFYQPVVSLENNKISSFEALLRWHHPTRGLVSPAEFIPVAEEMGLIIPLGEWVLRTACAEAANWPDDIQVAINVSSVQLANKNLVNAVIGAVASSGIPANRLELEITESVLVQKTFGNLHTMNGLHELGVQFAMDDFGTAYSSLGYLLNFPFHRIKIDRSFIASLSDKKEHRAVVRAITELGRNLNMRVTAEGIETEQQLQQVRMLGCTELQGYLISRPRPAAEILQLLASRAEDADCSIAVNGSAGQNNSKMCKIRPDLECNHRLTERECCVLRGIVAGDSSKESAGALNISLRTIKRYRGRIMEKLGAENSADLVRVMLTTGCSPSRSKSALGHSQSPEIKVAVTALAGSVEEPKSDPGRYRRARAIG